MVDRNCLTTEPSLNGTEMTEITPAKSQWAVLVRLMPWVSLVLCLKNLKTTV